MTNKEKLEAQRVRFSQVAGARSAWLDTRAMGTIISHLLKIGKLSKNQFRALKFIIDAGEVTLFEFKRMLREYGILLDWSGDMKRRPKFTYDKSMMIDGSSLSNNGKVDVYNTIY
jgi:hypothetical protein